jgi:RecJ-like exonuclease
LDKHARTKLCPKCQGVGLLETSIGYKPCRDCNGNGRVPILALYERSLLLLRKCVKTRYAREFGGM